MRLMQHKGFKAQIMKAERLIGSGIHGLPPGHPIDVYPVDAFKKPLDNWLKGTGNYVVPVNSEDALWFDWTGNDQMNTAVLPTVKGMNPITGRRTNGHILERYEDKCPEHGIKFSDGLYCEKCDFKWPVQNYIAYPNTLWWDGFRSADGKVRQFFFTEDLARSIPELIIGKEDTIPAFGFAFYRTKVARVMTGGSFRTYSQTGIYNCLDNVKTISKDTINFNYFKLSGSDISCRDSAALDSMSINYCNSSAQLLGAMSTQTCACAVSTCADNSVETKLSLQKAKQKKVKAEVGVGAGAEISQDVEVDFLKLTDWEEKPASIMRLYFIFVEQFEDIKSKGLRDLIGQKDGYLTGLPVG